jgi:hypothetical protein
MVFKGMVMRAVRKKGLCSLSAWQWGWKVGRSYFCLGVVAAQEHYNLPVLLQHKNLPDRIWICQPWRPPCGFLMHLQNTQKIKLRKVRFLSLPQSMLAADPTLKLWLTSRLSRVFSPKQCQNSQKFPTHIFQSPPPAIYKFGLWIG